MLIKDILTINKNSINPQKYKEDVFCHFSLPAFDNGKTPEIQLGKEILSSKFKINKPCILFNKLNVRFKRIWNLSKVESNYICSSEYLPLCVINNNFTQEYMYYLLISDTVNSKLLPDTNGTSSSHQRIDPQTLLNIEVMQKSLTEQQHIVNILGTLDDKIENLENCNNKLIDYSNDLYNKYFSQCEEKTLLSNIATIKSGFAFKSDWWQPTGVHVIKIANIDNSLNMEGCSFVSNDKIDLSKEFIANQGDIVFAMTGATLGKFCIVPKHDGTYLVNQRVGKFFIKNNNLPFLYCTLKTKEVFESIINLGSGSAQPNISAIDVNNLLVKYNKTLVERFNNNLNPIFNKIINNTYTIQKLNMLRQLYLKKFFA